MSRSETLIQLRKEQVVRKSRQDILTFTRFINRNYEVNWHHRALAEKLNAFARGEIRFLMVFMPPRHGKSELVSRNFPAFLHGLYPDAEIMCASYSDSLAGDMCVDVQKIMDSPEYQLVFPKTKIPPPRSMHTVATRNSSEHHIIGHKGKYRAQGVGGWFTGKGANFILVDDPIKGREVADSEAFRERLWNFWNNDLFSRLETDLKTGRVGQALITQTRWHEDDLSGRLLSMAKEDEKAAQWEVISYPAIRTDTEDPNDPREVGHALWPKKYSISELEKIRATAGSRAWNALYQQRPRPDDGNLVKREWIKFYIELPTLDEKIITADLTFKETDNGDFTVINVWGRKGTQIYLIDQMRARMNFPHQMSAIRAMAARHPDAYGKYIEEAANGAAVISMLKDEIMGLVPYKPMTSKEARVAAVSPLMEAGNIFWPDEKICPWVNDNIDELLSFPNAKHDDTVDCFSLAVLILGQFGRSLSRLEALSMK